MERLRMHPGYWLSFLAAGILLAGAVWPATAATTATNSGAWDNPAIWNNGVPGAGDEAHIRAGRTVLLTNTTPVLASLTVSNTATLVFNGASGAGTNILLSAREIWVYGSITHSNLTATNAVGGVWIPDSRVWIACSNLTVATGGVITASGAGYPAPPKYVNGRGPGGTAGSVGTMTGGAGHGGRGGQGGSAALPGGVDYGSETEPSDAGSSSGGDHGGGFAGGGIIRVQAEGTIAVNGRILASGQDGVNRGGGGAGGSILLFCRTLQGAGAVIAQGGACDSYYGSGGGGGGRIAVHYDPAAQSNAPASAVVFGAGQGSGTSGTRGRPGTLYFPDTGLLTVNSMGGRFAIAGFASWHPGRLSVSNGTLALPDAFDLRITNDLVLAGLGGGLEISNAPLLEVGGNILLTNYGSLFVISAATNGATAHGTLVAVTGNVVIATNGALHPQSHPVNGGSPLFRMSNLVVASGGAINADARGWSGGSNTSANGYGYGGGEKNYSGGGYGGAGAGARSGYGGVYGSGQAPAEPGSGGGGAGGAGGGLVKMEIAGTASLHGTVTANGGTASYGGSGGGIHLKADVFAPAFGVLRANGGTGSSKGGGGGRIALTYRTADAFDGTLSAAAGGTGSNTGAPGTVVRSVEAGHVTLAVRGSPVRRGAAFPYDYGTYGMPAGTPVTNAVPPAVEQTATSRYYCLGWTLTNAAGATLGGDGGTQAVFTVDENVVLTWFWTNQHYLSTLVNGSGSLSADRTGWYTNGDVVSVTATASDGHEFLRWSGSNLPLAQAASATLEATMDRPRVLQANFAPTGTAVRVWSGTGNWLSASNWAPAGLPGRLARAVIRSGTCTLTDPLETGELTVSNGATLLFNGAGAYGTNLPLAVRGAVVVRGTIAHNPNTAVATNASGQWVPDNGVFLQAASFAIATNGRIDGDGRGFPGGVSYSAGSGPGRTLGWVNGSTGGAGYGGRGGNGSTTVGGIAYGDSNAPAYPGSGSGADHGGGRAGGGFVRIEAEGRLTVDGTITVNGVAGSNRGGGGSGGGVHLKCHTFSGIGAINARGGAGDTGYNSGPGAGGRIAIRGVYRKEDAVALSAARGVQNLGAGPAEDGTVVWVQLSRPGTIITLK